ncbi:MAG: aspartate-semialdehyde dehydrogenase [Proteobacteria bacterium]|nr:aspartate-semialdehyde dehydrogenase [Pseudomonadota bacterium]
MSYDIAVVGASGAVGREMLKTLAARNFPVGEIFALASQNSAGKQVSFGDSKTLTLAPLDAFDFAQADIALFSAGGAVAKATADKAGEAGCVVIDNSSAFRMADDVPLIVPEVNGHLLAEYFKDNRRRNIIANPNCSTAQLVVALRPLHEAFTIRRVVVATYQSVSGAGKAAMDELFDQTKGVLMNDRPSPQFFPKDIAFNIIPHIDAFMDDGFTREEWKMVAETQKILDPAIEVVAHCARVPVFIGHSEAVFVECAEAVDEAEARRVLRRAAGISLVDKHEDGGYITPKDSVGEDAVYVSRLRRDPTSPNGLVFWCVSDNLRKGAALNTVQIAEACVEYGL